MNSVRHAIRSIRRTPGYALTLTAVVALGVALAATVFALVDGVLFKTLPYRAPHELFAIRGVVHGADPRDIGRSVSPREVHEWQTAVPDAVISGTGSVVGLGTLGVINGPTVWSRRVDAQFWDVVGVQPLFGGFTPGDYQAVLPVESVVISYGLWQRLYNGDPGAVGRLIDTGRRALRIVGVMPREFVFPDGDARVAPDLLLPRVVSAEDAVGSSRSLHAIARLADERRADGVRASLVRIAQTIPASADGRTRPFDEIVLSPLKEVMVGDEKTFAAIGFAALSLMVLLVAVNVGGLVATRNQARTREAAARRALGASTFDLVVLHAAEIGLLTLAGFAAGTALASVLLFETTRRLPSDIRLLRVPEIDIRVVVAAALAAALVAIVATLLSVRSSQRGSLTALLGQGAGASATRHRTVTRFILESGQIALAIALVVVGALFTTSLHRAWTADTGYELDDALLLELRLGPAPGPGGGNNPERVLALLDRVRAVPGVDRAAAIDTLLMVGARRGSPLQPVGGPVDSVFGELIPVSSEYFEIAGVQPVEGRLPSRAEIEHGAPVAVVSARTAREYWPGRSAVGQTLQSPRGTALTVIGVVKDGRFRGLDQESQGEIYAPLLLGLWTTVSPNFLIETTDRDRVLPAIIDVVRAYDKTASIRRADVVSAVLMESIRRRRFHAWLFGLLAASGLVIAAAGVFGLVANATAQRTREMGVRLALGSRPGQLIALLVRQELAPVLVGLAVGGLAAAWSGRFLATLLYEVSAYDIRVWGAAAAVVIAVAVAATLIPSLKASRIDPVRALRTE